VIRQGSSPKDGGDMEGQSWGPNYGRI